MNNMPEWSALSMRDRALYIRNAVSRGLDTVTSIRLDYNTFRKGGSKLSKKESFIKALEDSLKSNSRYSTPEWRKYLTDLAALESNYNPNAINNIGAKGYFLLMPFNRSEIWQNDSLQFLELYNLLDSNMKYLKEHMTKEDLLKAAKLGIDIYGLMAGAHLGGAKGALNTLRGISNSTDANGTSIMDYMTKFSQTGNTYLGERSSRINGAPITTPINTTILDTKVSDNTLNIPTKGVIYLEDNVLPEVVVTPKPKRVINPVLELDRMNSMVTLYEPIEFYPKESSTIKEKMKLLNNDNVTFLLKDLEDKILRNNLLGYNEEDLRKDVEDLRFYRRMRNDGGPLFNTFANGGNTLKEDIEDEVYRKAAEFNLKIAKPIMIGYNPATAFTMSNAGSLTGAHLSGDMVNYIVNEAEKAGVDLLTAFGIAAAESTIGNPTDNRATFNLSKALLEDFNNIYPGTELHINPGETFNELELVNFYYPLENLNPYLLLLGEADRRVLKNGEDFREVLKEGIDYADRLAKKPIPTGSITLQAFEYFKKHGEGYNPYYYKGTGVKYVDHVNKKGKEALQSPELLKAINEYIVERMLPQESFDLKGWKPSEAVWNHSNGGNLFEEGGNTEKDNNLTFWDKADKYADYAEKALALGNLASIGASIAAPNPITVGAALATGIGSGIIDGYQGIRAAINKDWINAGKNATEALLSITGAKVLKLAAKLSELDDALRASNAAREYVRKTIGRRAATKHVYTTTKEADAASKYYGLGYGASIGGNVSSFADMPKK